MYKAIKFFYKKYSCADMFESPFINEEYLKNEWYHVASPIIMCQNGFHFPCTLEGALKWGKNYFCPRLVACIIEIKGEVIIDTLYHKGAVEYMRIIDTIEIPRIANNKRESIRALLRELRLNHPELLYYHHDFLNKFTNYDFHSKKAILNFE